MILINISFWGGRVWHLVFLCFCLVFVVRMADGADPKLQALDGTCVAARTRPLLGCRRRRLVQPNTVTNLNGKVSLHLCFTTFRLSESCLFGFWSREWTIVLSLPESWAVKMAALRVETLQHCLRRLNLMEPSVNSRTHTVFNDQNLCAVPPQASRSSCVPCTCRVNPGCVTCGGWPTPREDPQYELPTLERLSRLDLGVHPILSFSDGQCRGLRCHFLFDTRGL